MSVMETCKHGVEQNFTEKQVRLCVPCIAEETGVRVVAVQAVLGSMLRRTAEYYEAIEHRIPPVSYKDVEEARQVLGRKGIVTFSDLGLKP